MVARFLSATLLILLGVGFVSAQNSDMGKATVRMVDADKGLILVSFIKDGAQTIKEYKISKDVKFTDKDGKKMKEGLKSDAFKSDSNNRTNVPVSIQFNSDGGIKQIQLNK